MQRYEKETNHKVKIVEKYKKLLIKGVKFQKTPVCKNSKKQICKN